MSKIINSINYINEWLGRIISLFVIVIMLIIVYEVIMRRVFNSPTIWVHELSLYVFGTMWVLAGGYILKNKAMVNMDLFYGRLSVKRKALIDVSTTIFALIFCSALLWKSIGMASSSIKWLEMSDTIWHVPVYPVKLMIPIGTSLLILQIIADFIRNLFVITGVTKIER